MDSFKNFFKWLFNHKSTEETQQQQDPAAAKNRIAVMLDELKADVEEELHKLSPKVKEPEKMAITLSKIANGMAGNSQFKQAVAASIVAAEGVYSSVIKAGASKKSDVMLAAQVIADELAADITGIGLWVDNVIATYNAVKDVSAPVAAPVTAAPVAVTTETVQS